MGDYPYEILFYVLVTWHKLLTYVEMDFLFNLAISIFFSAPESISYGIVGKKLKGFIS